MSLIIAMKTSEGLIVGSDSLISVSDDTKELIEVEENQKIWLIKDEILGQYDPNSNCIMGGTGTYRDIMAIRYGFSVSGPLSMDKVISLYCDQILNILVEKRFAPAEGVLDEGIESSYVLANVDHIYIITNDLSVVEKKEFGALGICANEALACIRQKLGGKSSQELTNEEAIKLAVEVFEGCAVSCSKISAPFYFRYLTKK